MPLLAYIEFVRKKYIALYSACEIYIVKMLPLQDKETHHEEENLKYLEKNSQSPSFSSSTNQ